jgi:sugar lactone lactonase YvrE
MARVESFQTFRGGWVAGLLLLVACGSGGGGGAGAAATSVSIDFPPTGCVTDAAGLTVRGRTAGTAAIRALSVNGLPASSSDGFRTWEALSLIDSGNDTLVAEAARTDGRRFQSSPLPLRRDPPIVSGVGAVAYDERVARPLIADFFTHALLAVDPASGERVLLAQAATLEPDDIVFPIAMVIDEPRGRVLVLEFVFGGGDRITTIDLRTGARSTLTSGSVGTGPALNIPTGLAFDAKLDRLLVVDVVLDAILEIDPVTGDRTIVSDAAVGAGPPFSGPRGIQIDAAQKRALVVDSGLAAVLAVDLESGDREIVSDATHGAGVDFDSPDALALDAANDRLLVKDQNLQAILAVSLDDGDRKIVVDGSSGLPFSFGSTLAVEPKGILAYAATGATLFEVDLDANAARDLIDALIVGEGQSIASPTGLEADPDSNDVLVLMTRILIRVDARSGDRHVVSGLGVGSGPSFDFAT